MRRILSLLSKLDAAVQRRFDSVCFFLMLRFGIRKSTIRYALNTIAILALGSELLSLSTLGYATTSTWFWLGLMLILLLAGQQIEAKWDREAETRPGMASKTDAQRSSKPVPCILVITDAICIAHPEWRPPGLINLNAGSNVFPTVCDTIFWSAWLALLYLLKTPMNPPAEKEKSPALDPRLAPVKT